MKYVCFKIIFAIFVIAADFTMFSRFTKQLQGKDDVKSVHFMVGFFLTPFIKYLSNPLDILKYTIHQAYIYRPSGQQCNLS